MSLQPRCYFCDEPLGFRKYFVSPEGEKVLCCKDCHGRVVSDTVVASLTEKLATSQANLKKLMEIALQAVQSSVPYLAKHGSFLIDAEAWRLLAGAVIPEAAALDVCLQRLAHGERPTEHEIEAALGKS